MKKPTPAPDLEAKREEIKRIANMSEEEFLETLDEWFEQDPTMAQRVEKLFTFLLDDQNIVH